MTRRFVTPLTDPEQQALTSAYQHGEKGGLTSSYPCHSVESSRPYHPGKPEPEEEEANRLLASFRQQGISEEY